MTTPLTVREACEFTGKSESTIKRLIRDITANEDHPERDLVAPSAAELKAKRDSGEPYAWKIDRSLLERRYPPDEAAPDDGSASNGRAESRGGESTDRLVTVLEKTISVLEEELREKNRQIDAFQERQREQNLLLKNLHDRIAISAPAARAQATDVEAETDDRPAEEGSERSGRTRPSGPERKQSVWTRPIRLFGKKT